MGNPTKGERDHAAYIQRAREIYADLSNDDIEIDDNPEVSDGADDGVWVQAWVWVSDADMEDHGD